MVIGTKLVFYKDSLECTNGVGTAEVIGFCKELPKDVLTKIIQTHEIHSYMTLHCPPLSSCEYSLSGICIYPIYKASYKDVSINGSVDDFLSHPSMLRNRTPVFRISTLHNRIVTLTSIIELLSDANPWKNTYIHILSDLKEVYLGLTSEV